mmetsp:Transcript_69010/g.183561  ORF Transcript_69010/g.183561 Transcript_69010/m.183561 type:complete len:227 (-) Transcript_69010:791-1471(-)
MVIHRMLPDLRGHATPVERHWAAPPARPLEEVSGRRDATHWHDGPGAVRPLWRGAHHDEHGARRGFAVSLQVISLLLAEVQHAIEDGEALIVQVSTYTQTDVDLLVLRLHSLHGEREGIVLIESVGVHVNHHCQGIITTLPEASCFGRRKVGCLQPALADPQSVGRGQFRHYSTGVLDGPLLRLVVNVNDAEALRIAVLPFKVVHEGPHQVATHIGTILNGAVNLC